MLDARRRGWLWIGAAVLVVVGGMFAASVLSPRDPRTMTTDELVARLLARGFPFAQADEVGEEFDALTERPRAQRLAIAQRFAVDEDQAKRALAASVFGTLVRDSVGSERDELDRRVVAMLDDADLRVRRVALELTAMLCAWEIDRPVPARAFVVFRELLASADPRQRGTAVAATLPLGRRAAPLRDELVKVVRRDPDGGLRFLAATALSRVRPVDGGLQELRRRLLDDPDARLRSAAAAWLAQAPEGGAEAIPRLLAMVRSGDEGGDVRDAAFPALARLVTDRDTAAEVLGLLLARQSRLEEHEKASWCRDVGRVAAVLAGSPAVDPAIAILERVVHEGSHRITALAAMARIAAAHRAQPFAAESLAALRAFVAEWYELAREDREFATPGELVGEDAVEALIELAAWPASGVLHDEVRPLLEIVAKGKHGWARDWASELLQRLPQ